MCRRVSRSAALIFLSLSLSTPMHPPAVAAAVAEAAVPAPARAFTPRTALAFYADVQKASRTALWNALTNKMAPLIETLQSQQRGPRSSLLAGQIPGVNGTDLAEIAVAFEGDKIWNDFQAEKFDPSSGFLIVVRLAKSPNVEDLIRQGLEAIDKEKPGLRGQIEKSRRRVGAAEVFNLPAEIFGEASLPFVLSCGLGAGKDGTIVGVGRSENLEAFLGGKTEGKLRGQINDALSRRGQIWLNLPFSEDAKKSFGAGGGANANPMLANLAQSMDKVRDASLILNFGPSQLDFVVEFGCADAAAAGQLSQGLQGLVGMIQLGAQQNPASAPPFIGKIKAGVEGTAFRLSTAFTMRDFDLALQKAGGGVPAPRSPAPVVVPKPEAPAADAPSPPPVDVEFVQFSSEEQESLRTAKMRIQNKSPRPVKELKLTFTYLDEAGRKLGQWTRTHSSLYAENLVNGQATSVVDCLAFNVPPGAKKLSVTLHEVTFADGEKWSAK